jgi:hypothetical protein
MGSLFPRSPDYHLSRLTCLDAQLDAGVEEKIMLVSRDEQSCLIVSYREVSSQTLNDARLALTRIPPLLSHQIKNCIESAFTDLTR